MIFLTILYWTVLYGTVLYMHHFFESFKVERSSDSYIGRDDFFSGKVLKFVHA